MSRKYYVRQIAALFLASCLFFNTSFVLAAPAPLDSALPTGEFIPAGYGSASFDRTDLTRLDITGVVDGTVIRWDNFDIGSDRTVQFQQTDSGAWVLNRVLATDSMATGIMGELLANGGLIIVNPHGIVFGDGAFVDARSFIASGLDIDELAFRNFALDGTITDLQFQGYLTGGYGGNLGVLNNGTIGTGSAGDFAPTEMIYLIGKTVTNKGSIITNPAGCVVMAAGESVYIKDAATSNVSVQVSLGGLTNPAEHVVDNGGTQGTGPGTVDSDGGKIILAAGDIFSTAITGIESLRAEAFRNITLEGAATATGNIELIADSDLGHGGDVTTNGAITAGGNVDIAGNLIELNEDVSANGGDLTITGRTSEGLVREENLNGYENGPEGYWGYIDVAEAKTLYASHDVKLIDAFGSGGEEPPAGKMDLFGHVSLTIEAAGGEIKTEGPWGPDGVKITVEDTSPASLTMKQSDPLNLVDYTFGNQNNTELTLESYNGSVAAADSDQLDTLGVMGKDDNAADQWRSITATAYTDITLQGHDSSRDITAKALTSTATDFDTGNITVTSDNGKVLVTEDVIANQGSISLTAIDTDNGGIVSSGNITASDGITLFGEVTADKDGSQLFDASKGTLWAKDTLSTITKTKTGGLMLAADTLVDLDGIDGTTSDSVWVTDGTLTIDGPVDVEGNLRASGLIHLQGTTNNVAGDILSTGSGIIFDHDVIADGVGSQLFDAGSDLLIAENEADIDKVTAGSLTLAGDSGIELGGNVTGNGMESGDSLIFMNNVTADGTADAEDQRFDAGLGTLDADMGIAKTTNGKLNLGGDEGIELGGNVETRNGDLTFEDAVTANGTGDQRFDAGTVWASAGNALIAADDIIKTTDGKLTLDAGRGDSEIRLAGDVTTRNGDLVFEDRVVANGTGEQMFDAGTSRHGWGNALIAEEDIDKTTDGKLTLDAGRGDSEIRLAGDVTTRNGDLVFEDRVVANGSGDQMFDAGTSRHGWGKALIAEEDIDKTTDGKLTLDAGRGDSVIWLAGDVTTRNGDLVFEDRVVADGDGDQLFDAGTSRHGWGKALIAEEDIDKTTDGKLTLDAGRGDSEIRLAGDVTTHDGDLILEDKVVANGTGNQKFDADGEGKDLIADEDIIKTTAGNLTLGAGSGSDAWIDLNGDVRVEDGSLTIWDKFEAFGDLIASKDITLTDDGYFDGSGSPLNQTVDAQNGTLTAKGWVWKTTEGNLYLLGNNDNPEHKDGKAIDLQYAGCLPAASTSLGNLELYAENGDIQISGDLTTFGLADDGPDICEWYDRDTGGVSVIADNGKIYTDGAGEEGEYMLNIGIVGNSDHYKCLGVDLPYDDGKAAIVVMSSEDLKLGPDTMLIARGNYYDAGGLDIWDFIDFTGVESYGQYFDIFGELFDELGGCIVDHEAFCSAVGEFVGGLDEAEFNFEDLEGFKELFTDFVDGYFEDLLTLDDRPAVGFLDVPATIIGGIPRDEGDPIDVAVYLASTQGNVELDGRAIDVEDGGTMVVDAYDTVSFGDFDTFSLDNFDLTVCEDCIDAGCVLVKLLLRFGRTIMEDFEGLTLEDVRLMAEEFVVANGYESLDDYIGYLMDEPEAHKSVLSDFLEEFFGEGYFFNIDRLEVSSRITEWLYQAVNNGTLPYADNPAVVEDFIGGDYILRGAGLGNLGITDGRAWVLENPIPPAPLYTEAGQEPEEQEFAPGGCPALMAWLANEIGVPAEEIQVYVANTFAFSTDIQPCEVCSTLKDAATILADADGTSIAALAGVVNEYITPGAPIAPEQMTLIAAAVTNADAGTVYAAAGQWLDAMALYVGLLNSELGYSAADSVAFAGKYTASVTTGGNAALAGYVEARLAELGL